MKSKDTPSATSLPELPDGHLPCNSLDGQQTDLFGQDHAPVSRFHLPDDKKVKKMTDIYGLSGNASSASAALQASMESKLHRLLPTGGLTMFIKGWNRKATLLGRLYCQLAVSAHPIKEIDCSLLRTPQAHNGKQRPKSWEFYLECQKTGKSSITLTDETRHALWATPNTMDHLADRSLEAMERQFQTTRKGRTAPPNLREQVNPVMWPKPISFMFKDAKTDRKKSNIGEVVNGLTVQTEKKGSLNPQFVCWLMGFSTAALSCMHSAMQSYRKLPRNLSKQQYDVGEKP